MIYMRIGSKWYGLEALDEARVHDLPQEIINKALNTKGRFDPRHKAVNVKSIGSRRRTSAEKDIIAAYAQGISPGATKKAYDKAKKSWATYKQATKTEFRDLVGQLEKGKISKNQFMTRSRKLFKAGYEKAYRLGTDASGLDFIKLPAEDLKWLQKARSAEYKYLDKFADDVKAGRGSMGYKARADMYVNSMDGIFDAGRVDAYPNNGTSIFWEISSAENCGDCIDLAIGSPYKPDTLPTTPRAGGTMCLSGCKCSLRIRYDRPKKVDIKVTPVATSTARDLGLYKLVKPDTAKTSPTAVDAIDAVDSVQAVDWNAIDDMVSELTKLRILETTEDKRHRLQETLISLDKYMEATERLPEWLDPYDRDVYVWHAIGAWVLETVRGGGE